MLDAASYSLDENDSGDEEVVSESVPVLSASERQDGEIELTEVPTLEHLDEIGLVCD